MADTYLTWWTSIETDLRKSLVFHATRDHEAMHSLIRTAFEAGLSSATPPSPSTAPEVFDPTKRTGRQFMDQWNAGAKEVAERQAFENHERGSNLRRVGEGQYENPCVQSAWEGWQARAALASRPAEVEAIPKPPRTPEEMVAFIGSHFDAMRDETSDPEDIRFTLSVHDLLSAMSDWFDDYAESAYSNEKSAEVDDEGLPPLPESKFCAWLQHGQVVNAFTHGVGEKARWDHDGHWAAKGYDRAALFTAEQYRQGQRDAVAADRARMPDATEISDAITEAYNVAYVDRDWKATDHWRDLGKRFSAWAAPARAAKKEAG